MKRCLLLLIILLLPIKISASENYIITNHLIDSEIEIAGALRVKELIVVHGTTDSIARTINYHSFEGIWDSKTINFDNGNMYNAQGIENVNISAFEVKGPIDFSTFSENVKEYFVPLDLKKASNKGYTTVKGNGADTYNIYYPVKDKTVAFYLDYVITNVIVVHNDISELNYTFKKISNYSKNTLLRLLIPYQTKSELYNFWIHGPTSGNIQELISSDNFKAGFVTEFSDLEKNVNVRVILPKEQIGIDVYLNHTKKDALESIKLLEDQKLKKTSLNAKMIKYMKWFLIAVSIIYLLTSFILIRNRVDALNVIYLVLGCIIIAFNYLFNYNMKYINYILIIPSIILIYNYFYFDKTKHQLKKSKKRKK